MLRQLVEHIRGGRDGIGAEVQLQASLLGSGDEAVGRGLVACDVHIASRLLLLRLDAIDVHRAGVRVVTVVVTRLNHFDVSLCDGRLLGEFLAQEIEGHVQVAAEEPADEAQRKHIAAF